MLLYHGTDSYSAENIINMGVDFRKSDCYTDNARGFYLTNDKEFAEIRASVMTFQPLKPVVIEMVFDETAAEGKLNILRFDDATDDWKFFVAFNRTGSEHYDLMNLFFPRKLNNLDGFYDVVIDVPADARISEVTDRIDRLLEDVDEGRIPMEVAGGEILKNIRSINIGDIDINSKQYSFHTRKSLSFLKVIRISDVI